MNNTQQRLLLLSEKQALKHSVTREKQIKALSLRLHTMNNGGTDIGRIKKPVKQVKTELLSIYLTPTEKAQILGYFGKSRKVAEYLINETAK